MGFINKILGKLAQFVLKRKLNKQIKQTEKDLNKLISQYKEAPFARREKFKQKLRSEGVNPSVLLKMKVK